MLLQSSRCPVFSFDTDIHGTRAAIALAERVGAAYDHVDGAALSRETALFTDKGAMTVAPGEVRRRADVVAIVGELPAVHHDFVAELADTVPDLSAKNARELFLIGAEGTKVASFLGSRKATLLSCEERRARRHAGGAQGTMRRTPGVYARCRTSTVSPGRSAPPDFRYSCFRAMARTALHWRCCRASSRISIGSRAHRPCICRPAKAAGAARSPRPG